jgi:glycosyltransferase involved in cell wall biosynthesis
LRSRWHRWLQGTADIVVAISDELAREAEEVFGVARGQTVVIPNGRDPHLYEPTDHGREPVQLIYVGQLEHPKRPDWFVEVVRQVAAERPGVRAVMVGDGPLLDDVTGLARGLPLQVLGRRDDVPSLLARSHILVSPSSREGMPGVFIEAGLSQVPVVATDVAGARTVVEDGDTGHIVGHHDQEALVRRTLELVDDSRARGVMGAAAGRRCVERFALDAVTRSWSALIEQLASPSPIR